MSKNTWQFLITANNRAPGQAGRNWDISALKNRIEQIPDVSVKRVERVDRELLEGYKRAWVWADYPESFSKELVISRTIRTVNWWGISKPKIPQISQVETSNNPPPEDIEPPLQRDLQGFSFNLQEIPPWARVAVIVGVVGILINGVNN